MSKKSERKERKVSSLMQLLDELGVKLVPPRTLCIYGPSGIGKSLLASALAGELSIIFEAPVKIYGVEEHYADPKYVELITRIARSMGAKEIDIDYISGPGNYRPQKVIRRLLSIENPTIIIIDSLSALSDSYSVSQLIQHGSITEISPIVARTNPIVRIVSKHVVEVCSKTKSIGIFIAHASGTAGRGKFRGLLDYRPSFASRVLHNTWYTIYIDMVDEKDRLKRQAICVFNRLNNNFEGRRAVFNIADIIPSEVLQELRKIATE